MPRTTIANTAAELLAEHRALAAAELGRLVAARGVTRAKDPTRAVSRALDFDPRFCRLSDGRWAVPGELLRGATLTHRLSVEEAAGDVLALAADLAPFAALAPGDLLLPDGRLLTILWGEDAFAASGTDTDVALQGPPGWLSGNGSGHLVHVRLVGAILGVGPGPKPRAQSRLAARRLVEAARMRLSGQAADFELRPPAISIEALLLDLLVDDPGLLEDPLPPLSEVFEAADLEVHRGLVGLPGTDWEHLDEFWPFERANLDEFDGGEFDADDDDQFGRDLDQQMVDAFDLQPREAEGLGIVLAAYDVRRRFASLGSREASAGLAQMLGFPGIARALAVKAWSDPAFEPFVAEIEAASVGRDAAGPRFVLGACAEARDDVATAERLYRSALDADAYHPFALVEMARYETDRGNYAAALRHLRAADVPADDAERVWLELQARPPVRKVGRNEPCPCGSGRKYKACHLDGPLEIGPIEAAKALQHKLEGWLALPSMRRIGEKVLREITAPAPDDGERVDPGHPMVDDIVLFDRGGLRRFLDVRGALLPDAEGALGQTWLLSQRSLYEVQAVRPGAGATLRDLRSDDGSVEVADRSLSAQVQPLDLLCLRLLPDGAGGVVASDGVLVPRLQRRHVQDLLDLGDGLALLRWIVTPAPAPRLSNTEGEPLQLVTVAYRVADPASVAVALGKKLRDDGAGRFVETLVQHGQEWIRGSITLDDNRATIDANSVKRAARLEQTLLGAAPGARLIRREERGIEEALNEERAKGPTKEPIDMAAHPAVAQALDEFIRRSEVNWVDEAIPALGGLTPREAAADRAARPELEALLDDMAWQRRRAGGGSGLMDPSRMRALLGIPERAR